MSSSEFYTVTQATPAAVYTQIEKDLTEAIASANLPATVSAAESARFTKGAARALLGKVYLYQNKNAQAAAEFTAVNGTPGGTSQYGYKLLTNFADLWTNSNKFNSESILEVAHTNESSIGGENWGNGVDEGNSTNVMCGPRSYTKAAGSDAPDLPSGWSFNVFTQDFYDVVKTDFSYTLENPQAKIKETQLGTLIVKSKLNKYKIILKGQELISDGKNQWTYLKADKEVQLSEVDNSSDALNPAKLFTIYEKGFKSVYTNDTKLNGRTLHVIDLTPLDGKRSFFKVRLQIDKLTKQIMNAVIFDKNGNRYTYTIKTFMPNVKVPESTFTFDSKLYPGVELVDLR
jgi:outer membrane lipoprotein-sorting protein